MGSNPAAAGFLAGWPADRLAGQEGGSGCDKYRPSRHRRWPIHTRQVCFWVRQRFACWRAKFPGRLTSDKPPTTISHCCGLRRACPGEPSHNSNMAPPQPCSWETLAAAGRRVGALLLQSGDTIAVSESATGGLASAALLAVPGASAFYKAAHVAYTGEAQAAYTPATLARTSDRTLKYGGRDFVLARAAEVRGDFSAAWGIAETSQTGPTFNAVRAKGGGRTDPVTGKAEKVAAAKGEARAWVAVVGPDGLEAERPVRNEGVTDREANMFTFAQRLLELLESCLLERAALAAGGGASPAKL